MKQEKNTFTKGHIQSLRKDRILPTSPGEIHEIVKGFFKNILQDALEAELDGHLGYEKH